MYNNDLCELWLADSDKLLKEMTNSKTNVHSIRDYFLESVLQKYVGDFSLSMLSKNPHGKPVLRSSDLSFNLSHSDDYFALLVCDQKCCGIDLQINQKREKFADALKSVLTDREMQILEKGNDRDFFQLWSVKEAYIKAIGSSIWFGRDYDFSEILVDYSDKWQFINEYYLFSTEVYSEIFLSIVLPGETNNLKMRNF